MKGRVRWSRLISALGVIAAVVIAAPAAGGSSATTAVTVSKKSLKNLVKKEIREADREGDRSRGPARIGPMLVADHSRFAAPVPPKRLSMGRCGTVDDASSLNLTDKGTT